MTDKEIREQIKFANKVISEWPEWKQNILVDSAAPNREIARSPVVSNAESPSLPTVGK